MENDPVAPPPMTPRFRKRGRPPKELTIIDGGFADGPKRPDAPHDLTKRQQQIWKEIVSSEPVEFFISQATQELLRDLVCHRATIEGLNEVINSFKQEWLKNSEGAKRFREYLKMRGDETQRYSLIATRLRLTNQSRYTAHGAAAAGRKQAKVRPWEEE